jgi:hypothetical protein
MQPEDDWFIAGVILPTGQCGYHLPAYMFSIFPETVEPPAWDGHTSQDALLRVMAFVGA